MRFTAPISQALWPRQCFPPPGLTSVLPGTDLADCFPPIAPPRPSSSTIGELHVRVKFHLRIALTEMKDVASLWPLGVYVAVIFLSGKA